MDNIFDGKYRVKEKIGSGGMSEVYLAENIFDGTQRAIKVIPKKNAAEFDLLAEPKILRRINHPALPRIEDVVQDRNCLYIVENYICGVPVDRQLEGDKCFDEATVVEWAKQLCDILIYLHNQHPPIIYRDMKPSNIIVSADGKVNVIDFGIAREYKTGGDSGNFGTKGYAAPEQYSSAQTDPRTDIYSLGATMYHMLTGVDPAKSKSGFESLRRLKPGLSEGIEYIVKKCVNEKPSDRYDSAVELKNALEHVYDYGLDNKKAYIRKNGKKLVKILLIVVFALMMAEGLRLMIAEQRDGGSIEQSKTIMDLYAFDNDAPDDPEAYLDRAENMNRQGRYSECIEYLGANVNISAGASEKARYMYIMGTAYFGELDYEKASEFFGKAAELEPGNELYMRDAAVCYARAGDQNKAEEILKELRSMNGTAASTYYIAGHIYTERADYENAIECYKIAASEATEYTLKQNSLRGIAEAEVKLGDYDEAVKCYKELIDMKCRLPHIYINLAILYQSREQWKEEEKILQELQELYPDYYRCYIMFAYMYMAQEDGKPKNNRDYTAVTDSYKKAEKYAPDGSEDVVQLREDMEALGITEDIK